VLTRQPEWTITTKIGGYGHSAGEVNLRVGEAAPQYPA
jgi:hypothetical protein